MAIIYAEIALLPDGWNHNICVAMANDGRISKVTAADEITVADIKVACLLPSPVNVHSHAFQRAMAGLTERRGKNPGDSFWTWRELM